MFREILQLAGSLDEIVKEKLTWNAIYTSPIIQNELVDNGAEYYLL